MVTIVVTHLFVFVLGGSIGALVMAIFAINRDERREEDNYTGENL